jgi:hypothetical protein
LFSIGTISLILEPINLVVSQHNLDWKLQNLHILV